MSKLTELEKEAMMYVLRNVERHVGWDQEYKHYTDDGCIVIAMEKPDYLAFKRVCEKVSDL
jgi:hypothetical protein